MNTKHITAIFTALILTVLCASAYVGVPTITDGVGFQYMNITIGNDRIQIGSTNITNSATVVIAASDSRNKEAADYICAGVDDQDTINTAIAAMPAHYFKMIILDGEINQSGDIVARSNMELEMLCTLKTAAGEKINNIIIEDCDNIYIHGGVIDGNRDNVPYSSPPNADSAYNQNGILLAGASNITLERIKLKNCIYHGIFGRTSTTTAAISHDVNIIHCDSYDSVYDGTRMTGAATRIHIFGGIYSTNNQFGHYWQNVLNSSIRNTRTDSSLIRAEKAGIKLQDVQNCVIANNEIYDNDQGMHIAGGYNNRIEGNDIHDNELYGICLYANDQYILRNYIHDNDNNGIITGGTHRLTFADNLFYKNGLHGLLFHTSTNGTIKKNRFISNGVADNEYSGLSVYASANNDIILNYAADHNAAGSETQKYGICEQVESLCGNNSFYDNIARYNRVDEIIILATTTKAKRNIGYVTENSGTATLVSGTTSIAVPHGLDVTPVAGDIIATAMESLGSANSFWVGTYTSTTFNVTVNADPTQDVDFAWSSAVY